MALSVFCSVLKGWWCFTETLERFSPNGGYWCQNRELGWWGKGVPPSHVEKGLLRYVVGLWAKCLPPYRLTLYFSLLSFQLQLMPQEVQRVSVPLWMIAHVRRLCIRLEGTAFHFCQEPFSDLILFDYKRNHCDCEPCNRHCTPAQGSVAAAAETKHKVKDVDVSIQVRKKLSRA